MEIATIRSSARRRWLRRWPAVICLVVAASPVLSVASDSRTDEIKKLQQGAVADGRAEWGHWGPNPQKYSSWTYHTNRLTPIYTFGMTLNSAGDANNPYHDLDSLQNLYGRAALDSLNPEAKYFDQTAVFELQRKAVESGKKYIVLFVFDGMDWQTTRAAAIYKARCVGYAEGRGCGLRFQDYSGTVTDFGFFVTSPHNKGTKVDVDAQIVIDAEGTTPGGYDHRKGGSTPWDAAADPLYPIAQSRDRPHAITDSASSATSMTSGIKTYNDAINVDAQGRHVVPIARRLQSKGFAVGVVTSVPISHATPGCAYANNVSRDDYQDIARDLVGLPSSAHKDDPLPGVDVLIGAGAGDVSVRDLDQGANFELGNRYLTKSDRDRIDHTMGGRYLVVQRTKETNGSEILADAALRAREDGLRLLGIFGVRGPVAGHLPFHTADGGFDPVRGVLSPAERYSPSDIEENPSLADMTRAALTVLETNPRGFWLMVEAGDVDWANHDNNIDNSIGSVLGGDAAFGAVTDWVEAHNCWDETAVIVTADHGHYLVLDRPELLLPIKPAATDSGR